MLYNFQKTKLCKHLLVGGALFAVGFGMNSCTDTYDFDTEQPGGLNSIYGYMADHGNFQNYMRIIQDLGQEEILSKTGSKTLFLANDAAFDEFYKKNDWNVSCYEELTLAQKKILLGAAMIDNPYTTSMLSTAQGPVRGEVCRRVTSQTLYDTVEVIKADELDEKLPKNPNWNALREQKKDVVLFKDNSMAPPTVHFTPKFLASNKLTREDLNFIYRDRPSSSSDDVYVGNAKITKANIFCLNGFIHEVDRVMVPLDNMAEILRKYVSEDPTKSAKIFSDMVERFAAPYYTKATKDAYNSAKGTEMDSVFVKRYFSKNSQGKTLFDTDIFENKSEALLKFDPGWNAYIPTAFSNRNILMEDMGVILAPTDDAMKTWWDGSTGQLLRTRFGENIEDLPTSIVAELLNNNFLEQLTMSLPSKFNESVYDDANELMHLEVGHVDSVKIGCNGLVYFTNVVKEPAAFRSVLYPAVVNDKEMGVIKYIIEQLDYKAYLNALAAEYTLFLPTDVSMLTYVDPVSYGKKERELWQITLNPDAKHEYQRLHITRYKVSDFVYDPATGTYIKNEGAKPLDSKPLEPITSKPEGTNVTPDANVVSRLENILDNIIVLGKIKDNQEYYPTKGRNYLRIKTSGTSTDESNKTLPAVSSVSGTWQAENGSTITPTSSTSHENGYSYIVGSGIPAAGSKSVADMLSAVPDCSEFYDMLMLCAVNPSAEISSSSVWWAASQRGNLINITPKGDIGNEAGTSNKISYLLNGYHYTIFAPTNEAMKEAYELGLPTPEEYRAAEEYEAALPDDEKTYYDKKMLAVMLDFVKYHIMDNSIYMDNGFESGDYQTAKIKLEMDKDDNGNYKPVMDKDVQLVDNEGNKVWYWIPRKPYNLTVTISKNELKVKDATGSIATVDKQAGYNIQAVEYWLTGGSTVEGANRINTTSSAVIHAINKPLIYDNSPALDENEDDENKNYVKNPYTGREIKYNQFRYLRRDLSKQE